MISSIGSSHAAPAHRGHASSLAAHQRTDLTSLLSQNDPNSVSSDDAKAIVSQIKELGIKPGMEFGETLKAAGFNPGELREAAGVKGALCRQGEIKGAARSIRRRSRP